MGVTLKAISCNLFAETRSRSVKLIKSSVGHNFLKKIYCPRSGASSSWQFASRNKMISQLRWKALPMVGRQTKSCSELALRQKGRGRMNVSMILNAWFYILFIDLLMIVRYSHEAWLGSCLWRRNRPFSQPVLPKRQHLGSQW